MDDGRQEESNSIDGNQSAIDIIIKFGIPTEIPRNN
jgi:hypothetical protein